MESTQELGLATPRFKSQSQSYGVIFSSNGDIYQLDYILIRRKSRNSVKDAQAYNNFASKASDHRIVSTKVRLSLRSNHKGAMRRTNYDWKKVKDDNEVQERYTPTVMNRFHALTIENESATEEYNAISTPKSISALSEQRKKQQKKSSHQ